MSGKGVSGILRASELRGERALTIKNLEMMRFGTVNLQPVKSSFARALNAKHFGNDRSLVTITAVIPLKEFSAVRGSQH